jgi:hypothetical protein
MKKMIPPTMSEKKKTQGILGVKYHFGLKQFIIQALNKTIQEI